MYFSLKPTFSVWNLRTQNLRSGHILPYVLTVKIKTQILRFDFMFPFRFLSL